MGRKFLTFVLEQRLVILALVGLLISGGIWAAIRFGTQGVSIELLKDPAAGS